LLKITSLLNGWELRTGSFSGFLELSEGRLRLHALGTASPPTLDAASGPFPPALWFDQSILLVAVGPSRQPVRWQLVGEARTSDRLTITLVADDSSMAGRIVLSSSRAGAITVYGSVTAREPGILITDAVSVAVSVPEVGEQLYLHGGWGAECQQRRVSADTDLLLESRSGKTGFEYQPYLALLGERWTSLVQLNCPGNWILRSRPMGDCVTVTAGLNPWGLRHPLTVGVQLDLPAATIVRVEGDLDAATQVLHDVQRDGRPRAERRVPVQFNSWYPHPGEPTLEAMLALAPRAAELGCETFVLDAGWYTNLGARPGGPWEQRLGDWETASEFFPTGLSAVSEAVSSLGMDFGIWFEPEAVSSTAAVASLGLPWLHSIPGGKDRDRRILHLGVAAAREAIRDKMVAVLSDTGARWIKWDFNVDLFQGGWPDGADGAADPLLAHYEGVLLLQQELLEAFPDLHIEMCAGGGGRAEPGLNSVASTSWMSDQTQAVANLAIHLGSQLVRPAELCNDWLIEWPPHDTGAGLSAADTRGDLRFRTHVAMMGAFGISAPLDRWSAHDFAEVSGSVTWYKNHQQRLLPRSKQYLLGSPPSIDGDTEWNGVWYAEENGASGTALLFRLQGQEEFLARMPGLDSQVEYTVHGIPGKPALRMSGDNLANGLNVRLDSPFSSVAITAVREEQNV
jgi:alpha-galactosidase